MALTFAVTQSLIIRCFRWKDIMIAGCSASTNRTRDAHSRNGLPIPNQKCILTIDPGINICPLIRIWWVGAMVKHCSCSVQCWVIIFRMSASLSFEFTCAALLLVLLCSQRPGNGRKASKSELLCRPLKEISYIMAQLVQFSRSFFNDAWDISVSCLTL